MLISEFAPTNQLSDIMGLNILGVDILTIRYLGIRCSGNNSYYHASIRQNRGGGLICGIVIFPCDDHYRQTIAKWVHNLCTFAGCLTDKVSFDKLVH